MCGLKPNGYQLCDITEMFGNGVGIHPKETNFEGLACGGFTSAFRKSHFGTMV